MEGTERRTAEYYNPYYYSYCCCSSALLMRGSTWKLPPINRTFPAPVTPEFRDEVLLKSVHRLSILFYYFSHRHIIQVAYLSLIS